MSHVVPRLSRWALVILTAVVWSLGVAAAPRAHASSWVGATLPAAQLAHGLTKSASASKVQHAANASLSAQHDRAVTGAVVDMATATNTAKPTSTNTAKPTSTNTAKPTSTNTAKPTSTNTPANTATGTTAPTAASTTATGSDNNKGTIKLSQDGITELPSGGSNEPKVCIPFYVQGYNLLSGNYSLKFFVQGGTNNGNLVGSQGVSVTSSSGLSFNAQITNANEPGLMSGGHYKVQVFDAQGNEIDKEKSKVFKVYCGGSGPLLTLNATNATTCQASHSTGTVTLVDQNSQPIAGATLTYKVSSPSGKATVSATSYTTDSSGTAIFTVSDSVSEKVTVTVTATYGHGSNAVTVSDYVDISFTDCPGGGTNTPEIGSGELYGTGLLSLVAVYVYRRRRYGSA